MTLGRCVPLEHQRLSEPGYKNAHVLFLRVFFQPIISVCSVCTYLLALSCIYPIFSADVRCSEHNFNILIVEEARGNILSFHLRFLDSTHICIPDLRIPCSILSYFATFISVSFWIRYSLGFDGLSWIISAVSLCSRSMILFSSKY